MILRHVGEVEAAVVERLKDWMPYMKAVVEQANGYDCGQLPALRGIITASDLSKWPEDQLPCAVVMSPGTTDTGRDGSGQYSGEYTIGVAVIVGAATEAATRTVAHLYGAAVRGAVLHRRKLADGVVALGWNAESLDDFDPDQRRTKFGSLNLFTVELEDMLSTQGGPIGDPPEDPCAAAAEWVALNVTVPVYPTHDLPNFEIPPPEET